VNDPTHADTIPALRGREAKHVADIEYQRLARLVQTLTTDDWNRPTDCDGWDVTAMARHLLGAMDGNASVREYVHQLRSARRWGKRQSVSLTDGLTAVQIADRIELTPEKIVLGITRAWPHALAGRFIVPRPVRRIVPVPAETPAGKEMWSLGFLLDVIYTRDAWMHRIDISRAIGKPLDVDAEHDGRLVADIVADWARRHRHPFRLNLSGTAGGVFVSGTDGPTIDIDAVEFARAVSGREHGTGLLATLVPF
jgi:uncharacterized protein (TIGR03083 family)